MKKGFFLTEKSRHWLSVVIASAIAIRILFKVFILVSDFSYLQGFLKMKVRASVKTMCPKCKVIKRKGVIRIICEVKKHKQRQG